MPWAISVGAWWAAVWAPKISIMPTTVPSNPSNGAAACDGGQSRQVALEALRRQPTRHLHAGLNVFSRGIGLVLQASQPTGQHRTQRSGLVQGLNHLGRRHAPLVGLYALRQELGRQDFGRLQLHCPLQNQGQSQNGAQDQRPNGPTCGLYDGQQEFTFRVIGRCAG